MNAEPAWLTNWQTQPAPVVTTHYEGPIITRQEARARGLNRYFTGEPCLRGHIAQRHVRKGCLACLRAHDKVRPKSPEQRAAQRKLAHTEQRGPIAPPLPENPQQWPDDGGAKRVPIYDKAFNPPRLIGRAGWTNCLSSISVRKPHRFFSPDVTKVRVCCRCKHNEIAARYQAAID